MEDWKMKKNCSFQREKSQGLSDYCRNLCTHSFAPRVILATVALAFSSLVVTVKAADHPPRALPVKSSQPKTLTGRIVFVDKSLRSLAVEIKGKILQVNITPGLHLNKEGKWVTFEDLVAGQEITLTFKETVTGRLEVVLVEVLASEGRAEAAGASRSTFSNDSPFGVAPNPANLGGPIRSPTH
jgi:hypothetical protein